MIRGRRKRPRWTDRDRLLMLAFDMYEASLCSQCGHPRERSMNPEMDGWYEVRALTCHACAALDSNHNHSAVPGRKPFVVDVRPRSDQPPAWVPEFDDDGGDAGDD